MWVAKRACTSLTTNSKPPQPRCAASAMSMMSTSAGDSSALARLAVSEASTSARSCWTVSTASPAQYTSALTLESFPLLTPETHPILQHE